MASDFAQSVKGQADIVKIIGEYVRLKKAGAQNYSGLCPFHKEKTPSFSVHAVRQYYYCFGCHERGDVFSFVQKIENVAFPEAVRVVAQKSGIPLPKREFASPEEASEHRQRGKLLELHELATAWFEEQLRSPEGALAREYLSGRGLSTEGSAKFRIGFAPESFHALRERLQPVADQELLRLSGLFSWKEQQDGSPGPMYARFRKRIMFPIANESGRVIAFTARTLESGEKAGPKYLNSPETPLYSKSHVLFNLDKARQAIRQDGGAVLVEGQMDCISVFLSGIPNVLATSGTAFTETQVRLLRRYATRVIVNFDPDTAGANAAEKSIALLTEERFDVRVLPLEEGLDPDRFVRDRGARAYAEALRAAPTWPNWLIDRTILLLPGRAPDVQVKRVNFLLPHISHFPDRVARIQFAGDAAQAFGIDSTALGEEFKQAASNKRSFVEQQGSREGKPRTFFGELAAKASVPYDNLRPELALTRAEQILLQAFSGPRSSEAYLVAESALQQHQREFATMRSDVREIVERLPSRPDGADPIGALANEEQRRMLAELFISIHDSEPDAEEVDAAVAAIRRQAIEQEQRQLRIDIEKAERAGQGEEVVRLTRENQEVMRRLREID